MKELYINRMQDEVFQHLFDNLESNIIKKKKYDEIIETLWFKMQICIYTFWPSKK